MLENPAANIAVSELGDSSVNFIVRRPWINTSAYWDVYYALTKEIKLNFDKKGSSIPYPQQDVHLFSEQNNQ